MTKSLEDMIMIRLTLSILIIIAICLPAIALDKEQSPIVLYEGFHIPIKFVKSVNLKNLKDGDKVVIAVNKDARIDEFPIFKEYTKGHAVVSLKNGNIDLNKGELTDIYGSSHPIEIKGFYLKDFKEGNNLVIPENYVIDAFIIKKKIYHPI